MAKLFCFTFYFTVCLFIVAINKTTATLSDYILSEGENGHCNDVIVNEDSVLVKSHLGASMYGGLTTYEANTDCEVTFVAQNGWKVLVLFPFFDLQSPSGDTCVDKLQLYDEEADVVTTPTYTAVPTTELDNTTADFTSGNTTANVNMTTADPLTTAEPQTTDSATVTSSLNVTSADNVTSSPNVTSSDNVTMVIPTGGSTEEPGDFQTICVNPTSYTSTTNQLRIRFISDGSTQKKGFNLVVTSFHEGSCTVDEFQCDTSRCISSSLKCDGTQHCVDGADEDVNVALCSTETADAESPVFGSLAVLALGIVGGIIFFAVVGVLVFWKYMKGEKTCDGCQTEPEDSVPEIVVKADTSAHKGKKGIMKGDNQAEADGKKPVVKSRKVRQNPNDVAW